MNILGYTEPADLLEKLLNDKEFIFDFIEEITDEFSQELENEYCKPCKVNQCNYCPVYSIQINYLDD